ncbi:hypothetical protein ACFZB9_07795 [Kitasatospora sp. NPDC008050]|uniref:hypothetical protein n=1 Tax=Kitasatospora sp. NPDC008050 TaxID=3364021 RepID=UPI0036ED66D8
MKEDITTLTRGADLLLDRTENPLHRRILENYRRHALLEVTGRWREVVHDPAMIVDHPVYHYIEIPSHDFISYEDAVAALSPLIRPLPARPRP